MKGYEILKKYWVIKLTGTFSAKKKKNRMPFLSHKKKNHLFFFFEYGSQTIFEDIVVKVIWLEFRIFH